MVALIISLQRIFSTVIICFHLWFDNWHLKYIFIFLLRNSIRQQIQGMNEEALRLSEQMKHVEYDIHAVDSGKFAITHIVKTHIN